MKARLQAVMTSLVVLVGVASCAVNEEEKLLGHWKSDEPRTLAELRDDRDKGKLTPWAEERIDVLSEDFFGRLEVEIEPGRSRTWFPDESPENVEWTTSRIELLGSGHYRVTEVPSDSDVPPREILLEPDGRCYRVNQPELGFSEWFCRSR